MSGYPVQTAERGHTLLWFCAAFPIACFTCALLTDIAYAQSTNVMWADFSAWLLAVGMATGVIAAIVGIVSLLMQRQRRVPWAVVVASLLTLAVAFVNNLVHSRDAWTSVMPTGLALSFVTILLILATAWLAIGRRPAAAVAYTGARR